MFSTKKQTDIYINKLFSNIEEKKVKFNFSSNNIITLNEGAVVFKKNDKSDLLYLILEGEVKLKIPNPPFSPKVIHKYKNEFFGEKELLENKPRISSCVAESDCQLYQISLRELQKLISENKIIRDNLEMVTIATEGKTLKEITEESKNTVEKINYNKAIKTHPEKPITKSVTDNIKLEDITIENIFKTDAAIKENIIVEDAEKKKLETYPSINIITEENNITKEVKEDKIDLKTTQTKEVKTDDTLPPEKIKTETEEIQTQEQTVEIKPEEDGEKISKEKYLQIIESGLSLFNSTNINNLTQEITKNTKELVGADRCILFFVNEIDKMVEAKIKENGDKFIDLKIPLNNSIVGICALRNKIAIIDDVIADNRFNPIYNEVFNYKTKNLLVAPIADEEDNIIAILELINSKEENFTEIDIEVIKLFSKSIILSLKNCKNINSIISNTKDESLSRVSKYIYDDIKNPLLTIKNYAKILSKDKLPEEIKQVLQLIIKQTNFVDALNDNLSTFNDQKAELKLKIYSFKETMNNILGLLAEYSESRNIELFKKIESDVKVKINPEQFMVVCYQIIKNSCDAQPEKGAVYITSFIDDRKLKIEFKDSGKGISEDIKDQILNKYKSFKEGNNYGVGLNIADKIIKAHNGNLSYLNSEDGGAVFTISLPVVND